MCVADATKFHVPTSSHLFIYLAKKIAQVLPLCLLYLPHGSVHSIFSTWLRWYVRPCISSLLLCRSLNQHKLLLLSFFMSGVQVQVSLVLYSRSRHTETKVLTGATTSSDTEHSLLLIVFWQNSFLWHEMSWWSPHFLTSSWRQTALSLLLSQHCSLFFEGHQKSAHYCFLSLFTN